MFTVEIQMLLKTLNFVSHRVESIAGKVENAGNPNCYLTLLPNDNFLDWSKLKAFSDDKINITEKL